MDIWSYWFFWALLTPAIWAIGNILDACLVGSGVYNRAIDGTVISAGFSIVPLLATLSLIEPAQINSTTFIGASIAGTCYFFHTLFFLKALFALNDATTADSIDTLGVVLVPALAYLCLDEILAQQHYLAIVCATLGTGVLAFGHFKNTSKRALLFSLLSVLFVSMASVAQAYALLRSTYYESLAIFSATVVFYASMPLLLNKPMRQRIIFLCRRFGGLFFATECLQLCALLCSYRAIQLAPTVSLVRIVEATSPILLLIFSVVAIPLLGIFSHKSVVGSLKSVMTQQLSNLPVKLTALTFISLGVWLIYMTPQ